MKIIAVHRENGKIISYKLENGEILDKEKCISLVKDGKIKNCNIGKTRNDVEFIRIKKDEKNDFGKITNLDDLPEF